MNIIKIYKLIKEILIYDQIKYVNHEKKLRSKVMFQRKIVMKYKAPGRWWWPAGGGR